MKRLHLVFLFCVACAPSMSPQSPAAGLPAKNVSAEDDSTAALTSAPTKSTDQGESLVQQGQWADAKAFYEAHIKTNPDDVAALYYAALARENLGDWKVAEQLYARVITLQPYHAEALTNLSAHALDVGDHAGARKYVEQAIGKPGAACTLRQNYALALAGIDDASANAARDTALACDREAGMFRLYYAQLRAPKHRGEAIAQLKDLPLRAPVDSDAQRGAGAALRSLGAFAECIAVLSAPITMKQNAAALTDKGLCYLGVKDETRALQSFESATVASSMDADARYYLAGSQARAKRAKEAIASYVKFLELAPKDPRAEQARARIKALSALK